MVFMLLGVLPFGSSKAEESDPAALWLSVYAWIQTADRLAAADQWPLALGSYLEANRLLEALSESHPSYEPTMLAYRKERLAAVLAESESRLTDDEHEVMMKYLDFIESLELGEAQRYRGEFEEAYATLGMARALLEEIVAIKPEGFREAVASQLGRLESGITWLDSQINFEVMNRPVVAMDDSVDWGTTQFVKESDLPRVTEGEVTSAALFPGGTIDQGPAPAVTEKAAVETNAEASNAKAPEGPARFRMSSRQDEAPARPEAASSGDKASPLP